MISNTDDPMNDVMMNVKISIDDYPIYGGPPLGNQFLN